MARRSTNEPPPRRGGKPAARFRHSESVRGASQHSGSAPRGRRAPDSDSSHDADPRARADTPWSKPRRPAPRSGERDRRESAGDARRDRVRRRDDYPRSSPRDRFSPTSRRPNISNARPDRDTPRQGSSTRWSDRPRRDDGPGTSRRDVGSHGNAADARGSWNGNSRYACASRNARQALFHSAKAKTQGRIV